MEEKYVNKNKAPIFVALEGKGMCEEGNLFIMQRDFSGDDVITIDLPYDEVKNLIKALENPTKINADNWSAKRENEIKEYLMKTNNGWAK